MRDTSNIQWLTAFDDVFDEEAADALYVCPDHAWLHTDSRYVTACENAARLKPLEVSAERETHAQFAVKRWGGRPSGAADALLGIEDGVYARRVPPLAEGVRRSRRGGALRGDRRRRGGAAGGEGRPIARMRGAQSITDAAFEHIVRYMRPGMMERQVQLELEEFMLRHGAQGLAFPSIVATGPNGASPHAIPGATMLEAGQCVVLDSGARSYGYCSDMTRTVFLGEPDSEMRAAWDALREANESVEAMLRPGVTGKEAHERAEEVLAAAGFGGRMGHGLGHGVGIDIHEEPVLAPRNERPLAAGNVVTVEPGIYLPGKFGMRLEDFGIVTDDGFDVFTNSTHDLVVIFGAMIGGACILVVEDDAAINKVVCSYLGKLGAECVPAFSGTEGLMHLEGERRFDLLIADLMLPGAPGEEVVAAARARHVPIIVLSARATVADRVDLLRLGADGLPGEALRSGRVGRPLRGGAARGWWGRCFRRWRRRRRCRPWESHLRLCIGRGRWAPGGFSGLGWHRLRYRL